MSKIGVFVFAMLVLAITGKLDAAGSLVDRPDFADLIYHPETGVVELDAADDPTGRILIFTLTNDMEAFRSSNTVFPFADTGFNTTNEPSEIYQADAGSDQGFVFWNLGEIFPTGMDPETVQALLTEALYQPYDLVDPREFDIVVVPEPTSAALIVTLLFGTMPRRSRKWE